MAREALRASEVVVVTGSSSGVGRACCERLSGGGHRVYGASRTASEGAGWVHVGMDVTDEASVERAIAEVLEREGRIDALVHCAGVSLVGPIEETTIEEAKQNFDTNFFGAVRVIRAVLPNMRRQQAGRIIVVGSIGGLIGIPYQGHYSAGKFALDGLVEALRTEVRPFGIEATVVHPGDLNTAIGVNRVFNRGTDAQSAYFEHFQRAVAFYAASEMKAYGPDVVARKVERLLRRQRLPVRVVVGAPLELLGVWGKTALPARAFEYVMQRAYGPGAMGGAATEGLLRRAGAGLLGQMRARRKGGLP